MCIAVCGLAIVSAANARHALTRKAYMSDPHFPIPEQNAPLIPSQDSDISARKLIAQRRSTPVKLMDPDAEGPDEAQLEAILGAALRVPGHRKLEPWRFIIVRGEARTALGDILAERYKALNPDASEKSIEEERNRPMRAPVCVTVVSSPDHEHKTPVWEQELSALCMNLLYAANVSGLAAGWISEWWAFDEDINTALGLVDGERVAGHIFLGKAKSYLVERPRPKVSEKTTIWAP